MEFDKYRLRVAYTNVSNEILFSVEFNDRETHVENCIFNQLSHSCTLIYITLKFYYYCQYDQLLLIQFCTLIRCEKTLGNVSFSRVRQEKKINNRE